MQVIDYFTSDRQAHWLEEIARSDWSAGQYLHQLLSENKSQALCGKTRLLLLTDGDALASFATLADNDDIPDTELTPWVGFVYTYPDYRGRHCFGQVLARARELAKADGAAYLYISTNHVGLYEKYGCEFYQMMKDIHGEDSRVYRLAL